MIDQGPALDRIHKINMMHDSGPFTSVIFHLVNPVLNPVPFWFEPYSSIDAFDRRRLMRDRRAFSSRVRFFAPRDLRVGTRLAGR
jgi:hypothetical protein